MTKIANALKAKAPTYIIGQKWPLTPFRSFDIAAAP